MIGMGVVDDELDSMGKAYWRKPQVRFSAIGEAWALLLDRLPLWVLTVFVVLVCHSVANGVVVSVFGIEGIRGPWPFWIGLKPRGVALEYVVSTVVIGFFLGGMFRMACRQIRGRPVGISTLFSVVDVLPKLFLGLIVLGLVAHIGFAAFVLPGFVVLGVLMFTLPLIVDGGLDAFGAIGQSWQALKYEWLVAAVFHMAAVFFAWVGLCFCGVGFLLTAPLYVMSIAVLYRDFFMIK
jgi:hypothetical protein